MISIQGKGGIKATVIQDSISNWGTRITTFELEYPRFIHAEFMTHRQFSRNAASSRAIPVEKMMEQIALNTGQPIHWGANQAGMQAKAEVADITEAHATWMRACFSALSECRQLLSNGLHKQISNRVTEPFQMMKVIVTATEWSNFFWLRNHEDAQPEIHELARVMLEAHLASVPMTVHTSEWHVPYVNRVREYLDGDLSYLGSQGEKISLEDAKIISASCCAQVSYRKSDDSLEKAKMVYQRLIGSEPVHASPVEHQATPMKTPQSPFGDCTEVGVTHKDRKHDYWSGNFRNWIQLRQLIPNNCG
jgi:thymidylate synthase ThyX